MRKLFSLIGFFICFPSFSILNISENTGIQVLLPLSLGLLLLEILYYIKYGLSKKFATEMGLIFSAWLFSIIISIIGSLNITLDSLSVSSILVKVLHLLYLMGLFTLFASPITKDFYKDFINGYKYGAIVSSIYAVYQIVASTFGWTGVTLLNNNPSFPSVVAYADQGVLGRGFGFTPEPGVLSVVLLPILLILIFELVGGKITGAKVIQTVIIFAGLLSTLSISIILSLPLSVLIFFIVKEKKNSRIVVHKKILKWVPIIVMIIFSIIIMFYSTNDYFVNRVSNLLTDGSMLIRYYSMVTGIDIFLQSPIYGQGVSISSDLFLNYSFIYDIGEKAGVDSIIILIMMQQGIIGIAIYITMIVLSIKSSRKNFPLLAGVIGVVIATALQCGYIAIYHLWILLGLGYANKWKEPKS